MDISIKLNKNFTTAFNKMLAEYGEEMAKLNGFSDSQLSYTDFIDNFVDKQTVDDASIDELIIFDDEENEDIKNWFENTIGLPIQLLPILISNLDDFLTHKDNLTEEDIDALKILASNKTLTRKK